MRDDIRKLIPGGSKFFAVTDCRKGYWQIPLSEESKDITTFITEWGTYKYTRAPMGLCSSNDEFCSRTDAALEGIGGIRKIVDDILISGETEAEVKKILEQVIKRCEENSITLSRDKIRIWRKVKFAGYIVSDSGVEADPAKTEAISRFPQPQNQSEVRSFLGLANQLSQFSSEFTQVAIPLRALLKKKAPFVWTPEIQKSFEDLKKLLESPSVLGHFCLSKKTELLTDASKLKGLGFALIQKGEDGKTTLIQCGSRSLTSAEKNYAALDLECLAIVWAIQKCKFYLLGSNFMVITDHRPLEGIFKRRDTESNRISRFLDRIAGYNFNVTWVPGKTHLIADALSRAPISEPDLCEDYAVVSAISYHDPKLNELEELSTKDVDYQKLVQVFQDNIPIKNLDNNHPLHLYKKIWNEVSLEGNLLIYQNRIIIPKNARKFILRLLHVSHAGISRTKKLANDRYYWPAMSSDIKSMVESCEDCLKYLPSKEKTNDQNVTISMYPMEQVSTDLFTVTGTIIC